MIGTSDSAPPAPGTLAFAKMCGAGNDFIVLDGGDPAPGLARIVRLCERRYGIGADGLMMLRPGNAGVAFDVEFFNADGSGGVLCGNGARCAIERARILGLARPGETIRFRFAGAVYSGASLGEGLARLDMDPRFAMGEPRLIRVGDLLLRGRFVDVGSRHFVVDVDAIEDSEGGRAFGDLDDVPLETLGRAVRHHPEFGPLGVNANFTELRGGRLYVRTFERGVEAETLACGTGSASSALVRWRDGQAEPPIVVVARSGDELQIGFGVRDGQVEGLTLTGPAFQSFEGRVAP
ncbi:MAG: diaminopimelate epimerase [Spirochaetes bacterium]|nr:diaminopimelate epimerase [Spirochaetota bacterium]MBU1079966.1 diaminopimelate epimerase [Spirochaetota bacterium]